MDTGAYSSWGCSACVMDFFGYVLHVLADDGTGGKRPGLGDVANEALNVWPCCESPVPIREVVPSALSGLPEGPRNQDNWRSPCSSETVLERLPAIDQP